MPQDQHIQREHQYQRSAPTIHMSSDCTLPPEKRDSLLQLPPTPTAFDANIPHFYPTERPFRPPNSYSQTPRNHALATDQLHGLPSKCPPPWKPPKIWDYISIKDAPKIVPGWLKEEQVEVMDAELRACEGVEMKKQFWALAALRGLVGRRRRRLLQRMSKRVHCTSKFRNLKSKI